MRPRQAFEWLNYKIQGLNFILLGFLASYSPMGLGKNRKSG